MIPVDLQDIPERELAPGYHGRIVHSDAMTFVYWRADEGAALPEHAHPHEQVVHLIEGELELTVSGEPEVIKAGQIAAIPGGAPHSAVALTACRFIDAFYPIREDYR